PEDLAPKAYAEYRHAEAPYIRNKEIVEEWQEWTKRLGGKPKWKNAFMSAEKLSLNSFRAWRKKAPQPESSTSTRSSPKQAATKQTFVSSPNAPVRQLRLEFSANFNDYPGAPWLLSSGTNVDEALRRYTLTQKAESSLHSFVVDNIDALKSQFTAEDYGFFVSQVQSFRSRAHAPVLPVHIQQEILKYSLSPDNLRDYLSKGWKQDDHESQAGDTFRRSLYLTIPRLSCCNRLGSFIRSLSHLI
ncbi:hypothetical protein EDD11_009889, partial [Mortierella claussenii]